MEMNSADRPPPSPRVADRPRIVTQARDISSPKNSNALPSEPAVIKKKSRDRHASIDESSSAIPTTTTTEKSLKKKKKKSSTRKSGDATSANEGDHESDSQLLTTMTPETMTPFSATSIQSNLDMLSPASLLSPQKKKKKHVQVVSPITGEKIIVAQEDLKQKRKKTLNEQDAKLLSETQISSIENLAVTRKDDIPITPLDVEPPEVVFVSNGTNYVPITKERYQTELIEQNHKVEYEPVMEPFTERFIRRRKRIVDFAMALNAGLCLCTLLIFPTSPFSLAPIIPQANCIAYEFSNLEILNYGTINKFPNGTVASSYSSTSTTNDQGELVAFLIFYSTKALLFNIVFQIITSLVLIGSWERLVHVWESKRLIGGQRIIQLFFALFFTICAMICYGANIIMIFQDTNLSYSQAEKPSYGIYGEKNWMFDNVSLNEAFVKSDILQWVFCNGLRGAFGLLQYFFWMVARNPARDHGSVALKNSIAPATIVP